MVKNKPKIAELPIDLSYGPLHPATQGTFRIKLELVGETVVKAVPEFGYLHKGVEKLIENNNLLQNIHLISHLGKMAPFSYSVAFIQGIEKNLSLSRSLRDEYISIFFCECERIVNHLINISTISKLIGSEAPYFAALRFREKFFQICEKIFSKRTNYAIFLPGNILFSITTETLSFILEFFRSVHEVLSDFDSMIFNNGVFRRRTTNLGVINNNLAEQLALSGPNARASGINYDIRKVPKYCNTYKYFDFSVPLYSNGDIYSRCMVRLEEIFQSLSILEQCVKSIPEKENTSNRIFTDFVHLHISFDPKQIVPENIDKGLYPIKRVYFPVESPRGELGFYIVTESSNRIYRAKINTPSFKTAQIISTLCEGALLSDIGIITQSLDLFPGEIDR